MLILLPTTLFHPPLCHNWQLPFKSYNKCYSLSLLIAYWISFSPSSPTVLLEAAMFPNKILYFQSSFADSSCQWDVNKLCGIGLPRSKRTWLSSNAFCTPCPCFLPEWSTDMAGVPAAIMGHKVTLRMEVTHEGWSGSKTTEAWSLFRQSGLSTSGIFVTQERKSTLFV